MDVKVVLSATISDDTPDGIVRAIEALLIGHKPFGELVRVTGCYVRREDEPWVPFRRIEVKDVTVNYEDEDVIVTDDDRHQKT